MSTGIDKLVDECRARVAPQPANPAAAPVSDECRECAMQPCDTCPDTANGAVRAFLSREYNKEATTPAQIARQREIGALLDSFDRKPA